MSISWSIEVIDNMWTVIHIAPNKTAAENLKRVLEDEGHLVQLKQLGLNPDGQASSFEILVPESEASEAHEVIASRGRK